MLLRYTSWTLVLLLLLPARSFARDDFQYRQLLTLKVLDTQKVDLNLFNQLRLANDANDVGFYSKSLKPPHIGARSTKSHLHLVSNA